MVPDPHGHDIKLNSFKTSVALKSIIILQNLITTNHGKSGKSKDDLKLTELDVVTMPIRLPCKRGLSIKILGSDVLRIKFSDPLGN